MPSSNLNASGFCPAIQLRLGVEAVVVHGSIFTADDENVPVARLSDFVFHLLSSSNLKACVFDGLGNGVEGALADGVIPAVFVGRGAVLEEGRPADAACQVHEYIDLQAGSHGPIPADLHVLLVGFGENQALTVEVGILISCLGVAFVLQHLNKRHLFHGRFLSGLLAVQNLTVLDILRYQSK